MTSDFQPLFERSPAACLVLSRALVIEAASDAYLRVTGQARAQVVGRSLAELLGALWPEHAAALHASLLRVLASGLDEQLEQVVQFGERHFRPLHSAIADAGGAVTHVLHSLQDVTELLRAEQREAALRREISAQSSVIIERQQLADWFQQAPSFMAVLSGPEHRVDHVNPGYMKLIGQRDILGKTLAEGLPDAAAQGYVALLDQVYRTEQPYVANGAKYAMQATPGAPVSDRYVDFVFQPISTDQGRRRGIFIQGVDVTERVLADIRRDALIALTDAWRDLKTPDEISFTGAQILGQTLGVSRVGYGTIDQDAETLSVGRHWNAPGVAILDDVLNMRDFGSFIDDLKLGRVIVIDDIDADPRTAQAAPTLKAHSAAALVNVPVMEGGKLVALMFVNSAQPRHWVAEDLALIKELAERTRTASERLRNALAMQGSEAKFRTIADAMPQMVWSTLADGSHDYFNQRWYDFTGIAEGASDGASWSELFHPDDQERTWASWRHSLATGDEYEIQYRLRAASGQYRWVLGRALPLYDASGTLVRWMGTCTDIHEQKLAEEQLRQAGANKDEFLAMLAHELRNPLAPISSAAQILKLPGIDEKRLRLASDIIGRQVRHMTELIDDLLDVSRVTRGLVELDQARLEVQAVIDAAVEQAAPVLAARQHVFEVTLPETPLAVMGDKTRLVQAIANLLNNAAKYTPKQGQITLQVSVQSGLVRIAVTDNGNGIGPALLPYVFDLFTQGERTPDRAHGGLGLGLTLVKRIVALHGGEVSAVSGGAGQGSTFAIALPLADNGGAGTAGD